MNIMAKSGMVLLPKEQRLLDALGENIKLARLRRKYTTEIVAERANISRTTLWHVEKGSDHINIGTYLKVMSVLSLEKDFKLLANDDVLGRKLQDIGILPKKRAPKIKKEK